MIYLITSTISNVHANILQLFQGSMEKKIIKCLLYFTADANYCGPSTGGCSLLAAGRKIQCAKLMLSGAKLIHKRKICKHETNRQIEIIISIMLTAIHIHE